jgi:hypothetical protein
MGGFAQQPGYFSVTKDRDRSGEMAHALKELKTMVESNASALSHIHETASGARNGGGTSETGRDGSPTARGRSTPNDCMATAGQTRMINGVSNSRHAATESCRPCASNRAALSGCRPGHFCSVLSATTWWALKPEPPWIVSLVAMGSQLVEGVYWYGGTTCGGTLLLLDPGTARRAEVASRECTLQPLCIRPQSCLVSPAWPLSGTHRDVIGWTCWKETAAGFTPPPRATT